ncbi:MAG: hypothetical protein GY754_34225 [bacterium]|nr:hypothetical protein [bacterium]
MPGKKLPGIIILIILFVLTFSCKTTHKGPKQLIAVPAFINSTKQEFSKDFLMNLSDMYATELIQSGRFKVVERNRIDELLQEHKLAMSGLLKTNEAIKIGQMVQAPYVLITAISKYTAQEDKVTVGDLIVVKGSEIDILLTSRVIEVKTGVAVAAAKAAIHLENDLESVRTKENVLTLEGSTDQEVKQEISKAVKILAEDMYGQSF